MLEHGLENNEAAGDSDAVASASNYSLHAPNKVFALIPSPDTKANFPLTLPAQTGKLKLSWQKLFLDSFMKIDLRSSRPKLNFNVITK